jgi:hypothetical protein
MAAATPDGPTHANSVKLFNKIRSTKDDWLRNENSLTSVCTQYKTNW